MSNSFLKTRNRSFSQSSIRKRIMRSNSEQVPQKQLTRNSTMASFKPKLERLIQEGKIQQIINSDRHSKANLLYSGHINDMQKQLANSKKSMSIMTLKAKQKQFSINKLKNQVVRLQKQTEAIRANSQAINKIFDNNNLALENKVETKQKAEWTEKSFVHMKQRLLKDEYFHKIDYETGQKRLQSQRLRSQFLQKKQRQINNHQKQLQKAVNSAKAISSQQTQQKNEFIDLINQDRQEKQFLNQLRLDKQKRQRQINKLSTWVIEKQQLNKYLAILYTHRVLGQIIRTKNNSLIQKYSKVQSAYLHIKSNTNISDFEKILRKMHQQDSIYDITVRRVSDLESQLQEMEQTIEKAKKERNKILSQEGTPVKLNIDYYQGIQKDRYEILISQKQKRQFRITQDDIMKQRIIQWGQEVRNKLGLFKKQGQTFQDMLTQGVQILRKSRKSKQ